MPELPSAATARSSLQPFVVERMHQAMVNQWALTGVEGDRVAPPVDLEVLARTSTSGVALLENHPPGRTVPGLAPTSDPHAGSGVLMFDVGAPFPLVGARVPDGDGPDPMTSRSRSRPIGASSDGS